jgi:enoyl-CoA hydratase/carnithine racemase
VTQAIEFDLPSSISAEIHDSSIAVLSLSRPEKRNAIDATMRDGIERFFGELPASIRAVVLCGNGTDFSAGFDLSMIANAASVLSLSRSCQRVLDRKPIPEFARFSKGGQRRLSARDRERDRQPDGSAEIFQTRQG